MSGLKSSWEIGLEKSDEMNPELKLQKKLTTLQKKAIAEIRKEFEVSIADKEVTLDHKLKKLSDRVPPEDFPAESDKLRDEFANEKSKLEEDMEKKIEEVRSS
tara:strand:- start:158 stop:466 length:309 start_codon:yes stop_codon:yes gene_type:complete